MITYLLGIVCVAFVPDLAWSWWIISFACLLSCCRSLRRPALFFACGILVATLYGHWQLAHRFDQPPRDIQLSAEVVALPSYRNGRYSLLLKPLNRSDLSPELASIRRVQASYYGSDHTFAEGDRLELIIRLKPPRGLGNPATFDLERYYLAQGVDARGYIKQVHARLPAAPSLRHARQYLANDFDERFEEGSSVLLRALVLGDRSQLSPQQWEILRVTGTAHLFVVSGLHVAVIAALGWGVGRLLQLPALWLRWHSPAWRLLGPAFALLAAGSYAWLSGGGIPVQRAWLMLAVFVFGSWVLMPLSGWQRWRLALIITVSLQPLSVLEAGFWLSFGAVALILWLWECTSEQNGLKRKLMTGFKLQMVLFVGMLPLMAVLFNQLSLLSVPVNLLAVPVISLLVWLLPFLLLLAGLDDSIIGLIDTSAEWLWRVLAWCAEVPGLYTELTVTAAVTIVLAFVASALLLLPMPLLYRLLVLPILMPLLSLHRETLPEGTFHAWMFDVGQGQAVLIETAEGALLYDTGPGYASGGAAFSFAIKPLLDAKGLRHLDTLIVSHGDSDHAGGYQALSEHLTFSRLYAGEAEQLSGAVQCSRQTWRRGGVHFSFQQAFVRTDELGSNNRSCILRVDNGRCSLLLTGDLDASGEYRLLSGGFREPVTWLVAGHHGSRDSTTGALLDWLQPEWVLVTAGRHNRFGHPHAEVINRLSSRGIPWLQTAEEGAIELVADSEHCHVERYRVQKKRYWTAS